MFLELSNVNKSFPGVHALTDVSFKVEAGEIHALMGENGAGKSTLIKVITGIYPYDDGEIIFEGEEIKPKSSFEAQQLGISTIYQELNMAGNLSIAENIYFGRQPRKGSLIDWTRMEKNASEEMSKLGINIDVREPVSSQSVAIQHMVALARVISLKAKLVIMDEPTSSLDDDEVEVLFGVIRKLKEAGVSVIFISHRLDEIFTICDKVTVLRNGFNAGVFEVKDLDKHKLISAMIGRDAEGILTSRKSEKDSYVRNRVLCRLREISDGKKVKNVSFNIKEGEILGLAGLLGSGRTETAHLLFGHSKPKSGEIIFDGEQQSFKSSREAIKQGMAFCSENRKTEGILPNMSVRENITITILDELVEKLTVSKKKQEEICDRYIDALRIKTPDLDQQIKNLSGGNQQKVLLSRWMCKNPRLLILDEPTRGIDVGAKAEIMQLIIRLSKEGISVLFISSEMEELAGICDRVIVIRDGQSIGEICDAEISVDSMTKMIAEGRG